MDYELKKLLGQTLLIYHFERKDFHNDFYWSSTPVSVLARIQNVNKIIRDANGQESLSTCTIYIDGTVAIDPKDKIVLPDGQYPEILGINEEPDEFGNLYYKAIYTR